MILSLKEIPMPPSSNNQYVVARNRLVPSSDLRNYKKRMEIYGITLQRSLKEDANDLAGFVEDGKVLHIDRRFYFPRSRLFTKQDKPKKIDVSNRIKAVDDAISKLIGIDDKLFFSATTKKYAHSHALYEYVEVDISPISVHNICI